MNTLESLTFIARKLTKEERKIVRRYVTGIDTSHDKAANKGLKLLELICSDPAINWKPLQLQKRLYGGRNPAAFGRLVSDLHKRIMEAMTLPVMTRVSNYPERIAAQIQFHRLYIKALVLFEAGDHDTADETLLSLMSLTNDFELDAERIITVEFLMHILRIYGKPEIIQHFKDVPQHSRQMLSLFASGESVRELVDHGQLKEIHHLYGDLKWYAKEKKSARALFILTGIEGKVAEVRFDYDVAEKYFLEQLEYCKDRTVDCDEYRAQVYVDIARVEISLNKTAVAKKYLDLATRCRRMFKTTAAELERLKEAMRLD